MLTGSPAVMRVTSTQPGMSPVSARNRVIERSRAVSIVRQHSVVTFVTMVCPFLVLFWAEHTYIQKNKGKINAVGACSGLGAGCGGHATGVHVKTGRSSCGIDVDHDPFWMVAQYLVSARSIRVKLPSVDTVTLTSLREWGCDGNPRGLG